MIKNPQRNKPKKRRLPPKNLPINLISSSTELLSELRRLYNQMKLSMSFRTILKC